MMAVSRAGVGRGERPTDRRFDGAPGRSKTGERHSRLGAGEGETITPDLHIWNIEVPYASEVTMKYAVANAWSINPGLVRPHSRGHLRLKSLNPADAPEIHANMLGNPRDLAALRKGMEISRELGNSAAMKPFVKREILPGDVKGEALDNLIRDA